jgi:hypothetical protein
MRGKAAEALAFRFPSLPLVLRHAKELISLMSTFLPAALNLRWEEAMSDIRTHIRLCMGRKSAR